MPIGFVIRIAHNDETSVAYSLLHQLHRLEKYVQALLLNEPSAKQHSRFCRQIDNLRSVWPCYREWQYENLLRVDTVRSSQVVGIISHRQDDVSRAQDKSLESSFKLKAPSGSPDQKHDTSIVADNPNHKTKSRRQQNLCYCCAKAE